MLTSAEFSLALSDEQQALRRRVASFAREVLRPAADEWDRRGSTAWPILEEAARAGLYGVDLYRSVASDPTGQSGVILGRELAYGDPGLALSLLATHLAASTLFHAGTPTQVREWLPRCFGTVDKPAVAALAVSEPSAGSDVAAISTQARAAAGGWRLDGIKAWISNAPVADVILVLASVRPDLGLRGQAVFILEKGEPGLEVGPPIDKVGIRASATATVELNSCQVGPDRLLGGWDQFERMAAGREPMVHPALTAFTRSRPSVAAQAIGLSQACLDLALEHAGTRRQFGQAVGEFQGLAFQLAELATSVAAAEALTERAAWLVARSDPEAGPVAAMAKLTAARLARSAADLGLSVLGALGYSSATPMQRWLRDARVYSILEGTDDIQRLIVSRWLQRGFPRPPAGG